MRTRILFLVKSFISFVFCLTLALPAAAKPTNSQLHSPKFLQQKMQQLENDPENFELLWEVAAIATRQGSYDEAISVLERILIYFPRDPRVRIELGVLYYRLGAFEAADRHFGHARTLGPTAQELERMAEYQPRITKGITGSQRLGEVRLTFGHTNNADYVDDQNPQIVFPLQPAARSESSVRLRLSNRWTKTVDSPRGEVLTASVFAEIGKTNSDQFATTRAIGVQGQAIVPLGLNFDGIALRSRIDLSYSLQNGRTKTAANLYLGVLRQTSTSVLDFGISHGKSKLSFSPNYSIADFDQTTTKLSLGGRHRINPSWSFGYNARTERQKGGPNQGWNVNGGTLWVENAHSFGASNLRGALRVSLAYDNLRARGLDTLTLSSFSERRRLTRIGITEVVRLKNGVELGLGIEHLRQTSNFATGTFKANSAFFAISRKF